MTRFPEIKLYPNVLAPEFCQKVIARFEADARKAPDPQPDYSTRHYLNISRCNDWFAINLEFCKAVNRVIGDYFARPAKLAAATHAEWSDDGYVVCRYDVGDACILHVDGQCSEAPNNGLRLATLVFYLNDVAEGGETWFPLQDVKVKPRQGHAVVFPVGYTHPHEVLATQSQRFIMQTWITDPNLAVVRR